MSDEPHPTIEEEPYRCQCGQVIGMVQYQHGRAFALRMPTATGGCVLVRHMSAVCECGEVVKFSVSDLDLRQVVLELKAARLL